MSDPILAEAAAMLREMEWSYESPTLGVGCCPKCERHQFSGHDPACRLAATITKTEESLQ